MAQPEAEQVPGITKLTVQGFKSIAEEKSIDIKPLTILAGANSSGKSSIMQPLLLMKQTLEATYDPGGLRLDGPHLEFSAVHQLLSQGSPSTMPPLTVGIEAGPADGLETRYAFDVHRGLTVYDMTVPGTDGSVRIAPDMDHAQLENVLPKWCHDAARGLPEGPGPRQWRAEPVRGFLEVEFGPRGHPASATGGSLRLLLAEPYARLIQEAIHVPGARLGPVRAYPRTATGPLYEGSFEPYLASLIEHWQDADEGRLSRVVDGLAALDLAQMIRARRVHDSALEVQVNRAPAADGTKVDDWVNVADAGLGLPHVLPVVVALAAASSERMLYIEQPEIHLHPRAQVALARVLADAALRGVRVVTETHSALLLLAVQTLIARGEIAPEKVAMHWFSRRPDGVTDVAPASELDGAGRYGDWPQDFGDVELVAENEYLDAAYAALEE